MKNPLLPSCHDILHGAIALLCLLLMGVSAGPYQALAAAPPQPLVAIHVSEFTQALETIPAVPPTPSGTDTSGYQWWYTSWHYFVAYESLKEALRSDGTPFVEVSDSDIAAGKLLGADGSPRYPIVISLDSEAIADNEISPIRDYVSAGGFLFVGSSAFTRYPGGSNRTDFALAAEMGLRMANSTLSDSNNWNWSENKHFTKSTTHRLTSHIPNGTLAWNGPFYSEEVPWGVSPTYAIHSTHWIWTVVANGATVIANGDAGPLLTVKKFGNGQFIYHGAMQPLIGHGVIDPSMYAYLIYRKAIEWAFESFSLPIVKLSPWKYPFDAALLVRHDFEGNINLIKTIKSSAQFEDALGIAGDYYFCTGALRTYTGTDRATIISNMRDAVSVYGVTIGSHNGGLKNPDASLPATDEQYWHWGPDQALDKSFTGYANGKAYASDSISRSFQDIEGWLSGLDNGRAGCGATRTCPRNWASPLFNATREDSYDILEKVGSITMGEQKISPFPHWTLSYETPGKRFSHLSLPASDWFVGTEIPQALDMGHTADSIRGAVDFYYNLGAMLLNFYGHQPSDTSGLEQDYVTYSVAKPKVWSTNATGIYDWWLSRSKVSVVPDYTLSGDTSVVTTSVSGAASFDTALEIVLPQISGKTIGNLAIFLNDTQAGTEDFRTTNYGLKVRVGSAVSSVKVQYAVQGTSTAPVAMNDSYSISANTALNRASPGVLGNDTDPEGDPLTAQLVSGPSHGSLALAPSGSFTYTPTTNYTGTDSFTYRASDGTTSSNVATVTITVSPALALSSLSVTPSSVTGGTASQGKVTLSGPAPGGGTVVSLSDNSSVTGVPANVTVPGNSTSATFAITTSPVAGTTSVTISAVLNGVNKTATLTVNPPLLSTLSVSPTTVRGGTSSRGTVTISGPAPAGGAVISLSDNSFAAGVPASVTVPGGSSSATFTITTSRVYYSSTATITAVYRSVTKRATLTVTR